MTVIAWDGKTLAADKLASNGATKSTVTKIFRICGELLGVTGNLSVGMEMIDWYKKGAIAQDFPASNRTLDAGASLIIVKSDGVWKYESTPYPFKVHGDFCAFGSGDAEAYVALSCGCDAKRTIELVCQYNSGCGNGVDTLELL